MYALIRGATNGRVYDSMRAEFFFEELTTRLLFVSRLPQGETPTDPHFPRHLLRRVLERMHKESDLDLSLSTLAAERGYSRAHFMRIFTDGEHAPYPPSRLRLQPPQKMLTSASM
jgi:AraC family transcriptional regulator